MQQVWNTPPLQQQNITPAHLNSPVQTHFTCTIKTVIGGYYKLLSVRTSRCSFCQGQDYWRRRGFKFVPIRHLEPPQWRGTCNQKKAQNGVPAGLTWVWVKEPGEEWRMLQARLVPHRISIFCSELCHPESLAPNSQLPFCSISCCTMWPVFLGGGFWNVLINLGGKKDIVIYLNNVVHLTRSLQKSCLYTSSQWWERAEVTLACLRRWEEKSAGRRYTHPFPPYASEQTSMHLSLLAVHSLRETSGRLRLPPLPWNIPILSNLCIGIKRHKEKDKKRWKEQHIIGNDWICA